MGDQARRVELPRKAAQVAVELGEGGRPVGERVLGAEGALVPGDHSEPCQVEESLHHPRVVGLADEAAVGLEQHMREADRLAEICQYSAHPSDRNWVAFRRYPTKNGSQMKEFRCGEIVPGCGAKF